MNIKKISAAVCFMAVFAMFGIASHTSALTLSRDLTIGSTGTDVKSLQQFLNSSGYVVASSGAGSKGYETTIYGSLTAAAVKKFQAANGISQTGNVGAMTRSALASFGDTTSYDYSGYSISQLQALITSLRTQLATTENSAEAESPYIASINVVNGGDEDYIDKGDYITITFSEPIDPSSINDDLEYDDSVSGITYTKTGGINVQSGGKLIIRNIASFDVGDIKNSGIFKTKLSLDSTGKILTIALTSGEDIKIYKEDFSDTTQTSGTIEDSSGNKMKYSSSVDDPTGTFGGDAGSDDDSLDIVSINVINGDDEDYIEEGDEIKITFNQAVKGSSINKDLDSGESVSNVKYSEIGGVSISSSGKLTVKKIASFNVGDAQDSGEFKVKLSLSSNGRILTVSLLSGDDIRIKNQEFVGGKQIGDYIENADGIDMNNADVADLSGSF